MTRKIALWMFVSFALALSWQSSHASAQECRDEHGEPAPCPSTPSPPSPTLSAAPVEEAGRHPHGCDEPTGYVLYEFFVDVARPAALSFTQAGPERAPSLARDAVLTGAPETVIGGVSIAVGARPLPWLRLPEFRLSMGGGDFDGASSGWQDGTQNMAANLGSLFVVRAELSGGFELPIGDFAIFAMGHIALAAYVVEASLDHPLGSLGVQTLAEDAWEAGWTVGVSGSLGDGVRLSAAYQHVHTGAERDQIRFGVEVRGP